MNDEGIPIMLDKERHLKLTKEGMGKFYDITGESLLECFNFSEMNEHEIIASVWSCLIWEDEKLSLEDVGFLLDVNRLAEFTTKLQAAMIIFSPGKKT